MSDDPHKPDDEDDLLADLDEWGSAFDALHQEDPEARRALTQAGQGEARAPGAAAEDVLGLDELSSPGEILPDEFDLDIGTDGEALGSLLGPPPPLPPVEDQVAAAPDDAAFRGPAAVGPADADSGAGDFDDEPTPVPEGEPMLAVTAPPATPTPAAAPADRPRRSTGPAAHASSEDEDEDGVFTSAPRFAGAGKPAGKPATRAQRRLPTAPTDEEIFGDLPEVVPEDALGSIASPRTLAESTRIVDIDPAIMNEFAEGGGESTRIVDVDRSLLAESARDRPRGPAIVRRDDLERRRRERAGSQGDGDEGADIVDDWGAAESTRIADAGEIEAMAESAAAAFFAEQQPEVSLELDGDFYDDIEIGEAAPEELPGLDEPTPGRRRTTAHLVRRAPTQPPPLAEEGGLVLEIEAEPSEPVRVPPGQLEPAREVSGEIARRPAPATTDEPAVLETATPGGEPAGAPETEPEHVLEIEVAPGPVVAVEAELPVELAGIDFELGPAGDSGGDGDAAPDAPPPAEFELGLAGAEPHYDVDTFSAVPELAEDGPSSPFSGDTASSALLTTAVPPPAGEGREPDAGAHGQAPPVALEPGDRPGAALDEPLAAALDAQPGSEPALELAVELPDESALAPAADREDAASLDVSAELGGDVAIEDEVVDEDSAAHRPVDDALADVDVVPELPAGVFPTAEPVLDFDALDLPDQVDLDLGDHSEEHAQRLLLYERELELVDESAANARLRLEAGRLAEKLGDIERARTHYEEALLADPRLLPAVRGLRRVARQAGAWDDVVGLLDKELAEASQMERRALACVRADLLMACGEQDLARVAVGELLDEVPTDPRALLAYLELAFVDGRRDELATILERLAQAVEHEGLRGALLLARARTAEAQGPEAATAADTSPATEAATDAYRMAQEVAPASLAAALGLARARSAAGDRIGACAAIAPVLDGPLPERAPALGAALAWRQAAWAEAAGDGALRWSALVHAGGLAPGDPVIVDELGASCRAQGDAEAAQRVDLVLAQIGVTAEARAAAAVRAARRHLARGESAAAAACLQQATEADPGNARAAALLRRALQDAGDTEALIALDRAAITAEPGTAVYERVRLAGILAASERPDEAIEVLAAGRVPSGDAPALVDALAAHLAAAGRWDQRAALLAELADGNGEYADPETARWRAARAAEDMAFSLATAAHERAGRAGPDEGEEPAGPSAQALAQASLDAAVRAIEAWQRVLDDDGGGRPAHAACMRLSALVGDPDIIDDVLARAQAQTSLPERVVALASTRAEVMRGRDLQRAEEIIREAFSAYPDDPRLGVALVALAAEGGRAADAAVAVEEQARAHAGLPADILRYRAATLWMGAADDPMRAAEILAPLASARPRFAASSALIETARRRLGQAAVGADVGRLASAVGDARKASGDDFSRLVREAEMLELDAGDPAGAVDVYLRALTLRPMDPLARVGLTRAAAAAREAAPVAELALADLKAAEERGDTAAKADAYEELARIDRDLRGDEGSALLSWESAVAADPSRVPVVRAVYRAQVQDERHEDLLRLSDRLIAVADDRDAVALAVERGRLCELLDKSRDQIISAYRSALERGLAVGRLERLALFAIESRVRSDGPSEDLAALEMHIADYFTGDARARAAFSTRAGETLMECGRIDAAIEAFQRANEEAPDGPGYAPALAGWREAAVRGELWIDVSEAAQREAELAPSIAERAELDHLAGVALMDKALSGERAQYALRKVLELEPRHRDAFVRLRILLDEQGEHEELAALLERRLTIETGEEAALLHRDLADLYRNLLEDRERAKQHLRAVLAIVPGDLPSIAALSDIAWEQGAWAEAAEALIQRARLEREPSILRGIFYRLGTIYAERLPNPGWAIKSFQRVLTIQPDDEGALEHLARLGIEVRDWKMALGACERLIKTARDADAKVRHLHQVGTIYQVGFADRPRAERAYRLALDVAPESDAALSALIGFYREAGDLRSTRIHLDRVAAAMRARVEAEVGDGAAYRVIARALDAREPAGVPGSLAAARNAAEMALLLGAGEDRESALVQGAARTAPRIKGLGKAEIDELLFPRTVAPALRQLLALLGDRIAKHVGVDVRAWGVGRGDRLKSKDDPAVVQVMQVAAQLGIGDLDLYVSEKLPTVAVAEPTSPISLVIGSQLVSPERTAELRFVAGRALKLSLAHLAVPARLSEPELGVLLVAALRVFVPEFSPAGVNADAVGEQQQKLRRLIPSAMLQELRPFAINVASASFDHRAIRRGIEAAGDRAGLIAAGSLRAAMSTLATMSGGDLAAILRTPRCTDLVRWAIGEDYVRACAMLS